MATIEANTGSRVTDLSDEAFNAFCDDISAMFEVEMNCRRSQVGTKTVGDLRRYFKKLTAVNLVQAEGALHGTFYLLFDQGGLFALSGVIVMLPEKRILEEMKRGLIQDAEGMQDVMGEVGNLFAGAWDRVFREEFDAHGHFRKTGTFIGTPWDDPEKKLGVAAGQEFLFALYEMTVGPYPTFNCGVIFPEGVLGESSASVVESTSVVTEEARQRPGQKPPSEQGIVGETGSQEIAAPQGSGGIGLRSRETAAEQVITEGSTAAERPGGAVEVGTDVSGEELKAQEEVRQAEEPRSDPEPVQERGRGPSVAVEAVDGASRDRGDAAEADESSRRVSVSATVSQGSRPSGADTLVASRDILSRPVEEIMQKDVVWAGPDDTVRDVLAKMNQHNTGYVMIGKDGVLEGLVSNSNILGAISPYLRPAFSKWRRPLDDASLDIKVKWIMSRPVRTIGRKTSVPAAIETVRQSGGRCLPVVDEQGVVQGVVTVFDIIFKALSDDGDLSGQGRPPQSPAAFI